MSAPGIGSADGTDALFFVDWEDGKVVESGTVVRTSWTRSIYSFPEGTLVSEDVSSSKWPVPDQPEWDFDGDGHLDRAEKPRGTRTLIVLSGRTGERLLEIAEPKTEPLGSSFHPLGDLDGDGRSELAIYHAPRRARAGYPGMDMRREPPAWVSIVSFVGP